MLRRIPPKNMEVPRALPVGLHEYFGIDLSIVWQVIHEELPPLIEKIEKMKKDLSEDEISEKINELAEFLHIPKDRYCCKTRLLSYIDEILLVK